VETLAPFVVIALLGLVVLVVGRPLRAGYQEEVEDDEANRVADLLAAKEAKYREIRDLELDVRTGKLSREDFRAQDRARRAEAVEILRGLDALGYEEPGAPAAVEAARAAEPEPAVTRAEAAPAPRPARVPST
jgi:hypothetical protein